ncbi:MAG: hypothetical protein M3450_12010 [Actinomycetota bacterium]|nr:hypothetical protein [Actinomycetota bacterium]MDQ3642154.1 hypothetical protein [Actinomycetota bacterium]
MRLNELHGRDGRPLLSIDESPELGYRLLAPDYGCYSISPDGSVVLCAPAPSSPWHWQGFLIGQMLPAAAVLHGLETLHASAVALGSHAVVITGPSGAGKSSLALNLLRRGAGFLADDVVALEPDGDRLLAHPGPALISVRHAEARALGPEALAEVGSEVGRDEREVRLRVDGRREALLLGGVYIIERGRPVDETTFTAASDPRLLLGSCFGTFVRTPDRLINQLDVCGRADRSAAVYRIAVPATVDAATLAARLEDHALRLVD